MDPNQSHVPDGSQAFGHGGSSSQYQPGFNPYMYNNLQHSPASWYPQGSQGFHPSGISSPYHPGWNPTGAPMMPPTINANIFAAPNVRPEVLQEVTAEGDVEILEGQELASASTGAEKGTRTKISNFNPDEDVNLVMSWLEISCDPITCNSQKKDRMWDRILEHYNLRRRNYPERTVRSLQSRWKVIKTEVGKFASFMADAIRKNPSGMTDADKTTLAAATFAGINKHNFTLMHCWDILKNEPKWQELKQTGGGKAPSDSGFGGSILEGSHSIDLGADTPSPDTATRKRPISRDTAKAAKKKIKFLYQFNIILGVCF